MKAIVVLALAVLTSVMINPLLPASAATWSSPTAITNDSILHFSPSIIQDNQGTVYLFWDQNPGIYYFITNTNNIANGIWPSPTQYSMNPQHLDYTPSATALKNGTIILFFASQRNGNWGIYTARYNSGVWSPETRYSAGLTPDQNPTSIQDASGKIWLAWTRTESADLNIKFVDLNGNGVWDFNEPIIYDSNGNGAYETGEPVIYGSAPSSGVVVQIDARLKFMDSNGDGVWNIGEFVVFDRNLNGSFDPKIRFVDLNNNNIWDRGEPVVFDANSDSLYTSHTGIGNCIGLSPSLDCMIAGTAPANNTLLRTDSSLKFVDTNGDGVWEPGEALAADANKNGLYDSGEQSIVPLAGDPKLRFVGPGSTWATGNTVVYDGNGNGIFDSKIKFVDTNHNGHWDPGETVVYDINMDGIYGLLDTPIFETIPGDDLGLPLSNDPALRFLDSNGNGVWDIGEPVVYDSNQNGVYDGKIKFVDSNANGVWNSGETVVVDANNNGVYNNGKYNNDTIIAGAIPANNTALKLDPKIKFQDIKGNGIWISGNPVIYDANGNNIYDAGDLLVSGTAPSLGVGITTGLGEPVIAVGSPAAGSPLKTDPKVKYAESDGNTVWDPGEDVIYDSNNSGTYDSADPTIFSNGTLPAPGAALRSDPRLQYSDSNSNNVWDGGEAVVDEADLNGIFDAGEYVIAGTIPPSGSQLKVIGETIVSGSTPTAGTMLKLDSNIRFADLNANGRWDAGEPVAYDGNNNSVFDGTDIIIIGNPVPALGTALTSDELALAGITFPPNSALSTDTKVKFVESNSNGHWDPGETVVYDKDNNGKYNSGKFNNDTLISGPIPMNNTSVNSDSLLKFSESDGNTSWENGESVLYDSNNNGFYNSGEPIVAVLQTPSVNTILRSDTKIKYFETGSDNHWDLGESVVYDNNGNSLYDSDSGEATISGPTPVQGTLLATDSNIKFVDSNGNLAWDRGESVVYDSNGNGSYNAGEYPILSGVPNGATTPLRTVSHVFYNTYSQTSWSTDRRLTTQPSNDNTPVLGQTEDGRVWITWSGERGGIPGKILFKTTTDGSTWTNETVLASTPMGDKDPAMVQDRNGTIWVAWSRDLSCNCGGGVTFQYDLYYSFSYNNGTSWSAPAPFMTTTGSNEIEPSLAQFKDKKLYIAYSNVICGSTSCTSNLNYMNSLITMHSAKMNGLASPASSARVGQTLKLKANVSNTGDFNDTFTITLKADGVGVATNSSLVLSGSTVQIVLTWIVGGVSLGNHTLTAIVTDPGESVANTVDNGSLGVKILARPTGDANGDCHVDIVDLVIVANAFGKTIGSPGYNPAADLNADGQINVVDLSTVGSTFGQACP